MTDIERLLFDKISDLAADIEDGETGTAKCFELAVKSLGLPESVTDWALKLYAKAEMEAAGIVPIERAIEPECEHTDTEDGFCLDCGEDRTEHIMSAAYDRAKDLRKYGE